MSPLLLGLALLAAPPPEPGLTIGPVQGRESFLYNVYVLGAMSGTVRLSATAGPDGLHARGTIDSAGLFDTVFPVHNLAESVIDANTLLPGRYTMLTDEGHLVSRYLITFDQARKKVTRAKTAQQGQGPVAKRSFDVRGIPALFDMLSCVIHLRAQTLAPDEEGTFMGFSGNFVYQVKYHAFAPASVYTEAGVREGVRVRTTVRRWDHERMRPSADNWVKSVDLWFSNDRMHMPLAIEVNLFVGFVKVLLARVESE
jgi:hypothetical protein